MSAFCKTGYVFHLSLFRSLLCRGFFSSSSYMFLSISFHFILSLPSSRAFDKRNKQIKKKTQNYYKRNGYRKGERNDNECSCIETKCHINISWASILDLESWMLRMANDILKLATTIIVWWK